MGNSLYADIDKTEKLREFITNSSKELTDMIKQYSQMQNKENHLKEILDALEDVDDVLQFNGFTYSPDEYTDYEEDDFEDVIEMFGEFLLRYTESFELSDIEIYNTEVKTMISLIDRHMNGFVNENAVIVED